MTRSVALIVVLVGTLLGACSVVGPAPSGETVCDRLDRVTAEVEAFRALDPATTPLDAYRAAWSEVVASVSALFDGDRAFADVDTNPLRLAIRDLSRAIESLPDDVNLAEALELLQPEIAAVSAARSALSERLGCLQR